MDISYPYISQVFVYVILSLLGVSHLAVLLRKSESFINSVLYKLRDS
ncbi:228_t:CDS:2 [Diversispora eburnea]|uniref:228_t:CDS:1 n=1 Tax=Diversispora eburnea TaxID=1213867 RepID=A0A9N8ZFR1_9GLOM|nr:228_t:CDS:2 [Diversispora eburnea]